MIDWSPVSSIIKLFSLIQIVNETMLNGARKISFLDNVSDVMRKLNYRSDPLVRDHDPKLFCDYCGSGGHTVVGCSYLKTTTTVEDELLNDIIKI